MFSINHIKSRRSSLYMRITTAIVVVAVVAVGSLSFAASSSNTTGIKVDNILSDAQSRFESNKTG